MVSNESIHIFVQLQPCISLDTLKENIRNIQNDMSRSKAITLFINTVDKAICFG